jgi:hypothetical protein
VFTERVMRTADGSVHYGRWEWEQRELPPGALYDAHWSSSKGPDGIALVCVCPPLGARNDWHVDDPARPSDKRWTRTGDPTSSPPTVTAHPSIAIGLTVVDGAWAHQGPTYYHGHLRDGVLVQVP